MTIHTWVWFLGTPFCSLWQDLQKGKMVLLKGILLRILILFQRVKEVFGGLWLFWVSLKIESKQHLSFLLALPSREHSLQTAPPGPPDRGLPQTVVVRLLQGSAGDTALFLAQKGAHGQDNEAVSDQCSTFSSLERKQPHQAHLSSSPVTKTVHQVCLPKSGWNPLLPSSPKADGFIYTIIKIYWLKWNILSVINFILVKILNCAIIGIISLFLRHEFSVEIISALPSGQGGWRWLLEVPQDSAHEEKQEINGGHPSVLISVG